MVVARARGRREWGVTVQWVEMQFVKINIFFFETDGGDDCTTVRMCVKPRSCTLVRKLKWQLYVTHTLSQLREREKQPMFL